LVQVEALALVHLVVDHKVRQVVYRITQVSSPVEAVVAVVEEVRH
jgi:hypothetical protein